MPGEPTTTTLPQLRARIKQLGIPHWRLAQKSGYSEAWFSKVLNGRVKLPAEFIGRCLDAVAAVVRERRPADPASGEDVPA